MRRYLEYKGRNMLLCEWAKEFKMSPKTLARRLGLGWSLDYALTRPVRSRCNDSLATARKEGYNIYFSIPCKKCGNKFRYVSNYNCVNCSLVRYRKAAPKKVSQ